MSAAAHNGGFSTFRSSTRHRPSSPAQRLTVTGAVAVVSSKVTLSTAVPGCSPLTTPAASTVATSSSEEAYDAKSVTSTAVSCEYSPVTLIFPVSPAANSISPGLTARPPTPAPPLRRRRPSPSPPPPFLSPPFPVARVDVHERVLRLVKDVVSDEEV